MKSYRAEVIANECRYLSGTYATRELAASALPRLLSTQYWQLRLGSGEALPRWGIGIIEEEGPASERELGGVDLAQFSEGLRRRLYDQVVADYFSPPPGEEGEPRGRWPPYSPEEARLEVFYLGARWFVRWSRLELEQGSDEEGCELLRIYSTARGITYCEV